MNRLLRCVALVGLVLSLSGCARSSDVEALRHEVAALKAASTATPARTESTPTEEERLRFEHLAKSVVTRRTYYAANDVAGKADLTAPIVIDFVAGSRTAFGSSRGQDQHQIFINIRSSLCAREAELVRIGDPIPFSCWEVAANKVTQDDLRASGLLR